MIRQNLFYTSDDMYSYDMRLCKQMFYHDGIDGQPESDAYIQHFVERFKKKEWSALHIVSIEMDPANGVMNVLKNEFMTHPLKNKIVINAKAATAKPVAKKNIVWNQLVQQAGLPSFDEIIAENP